MTTIDNLRKAAKRWLKSVREGDPEARARLARAYPGAPSTPTLRDVQHALARERGHQSWMALTRAVGDARASETPLTALLSAAGKGDAAAVATILDEHPGLINERGTLPANSGLRTALHFGSGHEAVVRTLLERGADPNIRDEGDHAFPIHFAAERGDLTVVRLLIEHGADPIGGNTTHELDVLGWAVCFDYAMHVDVARYLLAHGARHTLLSAVAMGEADVIRALAAAGADLTQRMDRTNQRRTPLHLAVIKKQVAAVAALIDLGADLNLEDAVGLTPLDQAALDGEHEMVRLLIDAGAAIALPAAIALERPDQIDRLVRDNPEALSTTNNRQWARLLVHASSRASGRVIETLLRTIMRHRSGLSIVNMEDDRDTAVDGASGYTPLHAAAFHGNDDAVAVLLTHGANPRTRDGKYRATPAGWAAYAGHTATANLILDADIDLFDAISFDRADRMSDILDRDPGAIDRPFRAYASCNPRDDQWWPAPDCTPLQWATTQQKPNAVRVLTERGAGARTPDDIQHAARIVAFLQSACWDHHVHGRGTIGCTTTRRSACSRTIARLPVTISTPRSCAAIGKRWHAFLLRGRTPRVRAAEPAAGRPSCIWPTRGSRTRPRSSMHWRLHACCWSDGADPNDFYMAGDARYTSSPAWLVKANRTRHAQPYAAALFELLLERGAEPFDIQVLYNTHFSGDILWWLDLVYKHTVHTARGAAWSDPDWTMFDMGAYGSGARFLLETAVKTRNMPLAEWVLAHGANPNAAPARDKRFPKRSLYELALMEGLPEMADLLARHGAARIRSCPRRARAIPRCVLPARSRSVAAIVGRPP